MAKLTKAEAKKHHEAEQLLEKDVWSHDDRVFFTTHWQESANHVNTTHGAFFTPLDYAMDVALDVGPGKVVDLCAGIGTLSYAALLRNGAENVDITCVELNPAYVEIGRKMLPEARWICGDVFEVLPELGERFEYAVSNPPFGRIKADWTGRYTGPDFEYKVIDLASQYAEQGTFVLPQMSAGFAYSGVRYYERRDDDNKYAKFAEQTGIHLDIGAGMDTSCEYYDRWHGVAPVTEVAIAFFDELEPAAEQEKVLESALF